jgi:hypothetical protein
MGHAPCRLDVLDLIRVENGAVVGLRMELVYHLGYAEHDGPARYHCDARVEDAPGLDRLGCLHPGDGGPLADQILDVLTDDQDALLPAVRRLLGLATRVCPYPSMPCPPSDCAGHLLALPDQWLVICSSRHLEHGWGPADEDGLGRTARAKADERTG